MSYLSDLIQAASREGESAFQAGARGASEQRVARLKALLQQQGEERDIERVKQLASEAPEGASVHVGKAAIGVDPAARAVMMAPKEALSFRNVADKAYKPINDHLNASKSTLDALNQGNAVSDKLALINEARLAAGMGGSRAVAHLVDLLSGGKTANSSYQEKVNWLENTPNIPTLQPAQRNAIRESVFGRLPQLEQMHNQVVSQLSSQGQAVAPHADYGSILHSYTNPAQENLSQLKEMQARYTEGKQKQDAQVSQPSEFSPQPSNLDRLKSFLGGLGASKAQAGAQAQSSGGVDMDAIQAEVARRKKAAGGSQ